MSGVADLFRELSRVELLVTKGLLEKAMVDALCRKCVEEKISYAETATRIAALADGVPELTNDLTGHTGSVAA